MSKNLIIMIIVGLCLLASVWGSVVDRKRADFKEQLRDCKAKVTAMESELEEDRRRLDADAARAKAMLKLREQAIADKNTDLVALKKSLTETQTRLVRLENEVNGNDEALRGARQVVTAREQALVALQTRLDGAMRENKALKDEMKAGGGEAAKLQRQIAEANNHLREAVKQVAADEATQKSLRAELAKRGEAGDGQEQELAELRKLVEQQRGTIQELIARGVARAAAAAPVNDQRVAELERELAQARDVQAKMQAHILTMEEQGRRQAMEVEDWQRQLRRSELNTDVLLNTISQQNARIEQLGESRNSAPAREAAPAK